MGRAAEYLINSEIIDWDHPAVLQQAKALARTEVDPRAIIRNCFEWVRDEILHSRDYQRNSSTWRASDVLQYRTGYCYAKSHLLAALLRANGIPAGLCYQRLSTGDSRPPYCLHGFHAVWLPEFGWYRFIAMGTISWMALGNPIST